MSKGEWGRTGRRGQGTLWSTSATPTKRRRWCGGAAEAELALEVSAQGPAGSVQSQARRAALLRDPPPRIGLPSMPKHGSWLTQREIWVRRRVRTVRTRGSGPAGAERQATILRLIADENRTLANPFKWTYQGTPLGAETMMLLRPT